MQLITLILVWMFNQSMDKTFEYKKNSDASGVTSLGMPMHQAAQFLFILMLLESIIAWIFSAIKSWDISKRGVANEYGIESTCCSMVCDGLLFLIDIVVFGLSAVYLANVGDQMHTLPILSYFIITNMCILI